LRKILTEMGSEPFEPEEADEVLNEIQFDPDGLVQQEGEYTKCTVRYTQCIVKYTICRVRYTWFILRYISYIVMVHTSYSEV